MKGKILVVDDELNLTLVIEAMLKKAGFEVVAKNDPFEALEAAKTERFEAAVSDLVMPGMDGLALLSKVRALQPNLPFILVTAHGTVEAAVQALKKGAFDFVTKPFERAELLSAVKKAVETFRASEEDASGFSPLFSITGKSPAVQEIFRLIEKVARSPSTILITGESGTGKELVAHEIHRRSNRSEEAFLKINCAAIPGPLIESELFGHEKGAFTGAVAAKPGRFELADQGTLFLDEVADMPAEMQVKLLRVLQEQEFMRVGGIERIRVDVRLIAATNKVLADEVAAGRFREDLFYRLNVVPITLPPLRERVEDIEALARSFLRAFNDKLGKKVERIDPQVLGALRLYPWPGNIRQLENVIERMVLLADGDSLEAKVLPPEISKLVPGGEIEEGSGEDSPPTFKEIVKRETQKVERELIERTLQETEGNVTRAAESLGLSRKGLQLKMKELGIRTR